MERDVFAGRLHDAAIAASEFARTYIEESLPAPIRFRLRLNSSYDGNARPGDEHVFPDDSLFARAEAARDCDEHEVIDILWRDGCVPEWIDVAAIGETGTSTLVQLQCCGRFTARDDLLYHEHEGRPPFHITGSTLPIGWTEGSRFSIYDRAQCWTTAEIAHLGPHAHKVWLLDLVGDAADDRALAALPALSRLEILELTATALDGSGLVELRRFPKLRVLRIALARNDGFRLPRLTGPLEALDVLEIQDLPARPWGFGDFVDRAPNLTWLTLGARDELVAEDRCPPGVRTLVVRAQRITGGFRPPPQLDSLHAHLADMHDRDLDAWLASVTAIRGLDLSGTPISDGLAEDLPRRFGLRYLNLERTQVSGAALQRIAAASPKLRLLPRQSRA